jgi:hypothetical protein
MRLPSKRTVAGATLLPLSAAVVAGCADKFTGGGTIPSTDDVQGDLANFGFTYKVTDQSTGAGKTQGTYHDQFAPDYPLGGLELRFTGLLSSDTGSSPCAATALKGTVSYTSQNSNYPGSGQAILKACDFGQPRNFPSDNLGIEVLSGPYSGYSNEGFLTGGNLQAH